MYQNGNGNGSWFYRAQAPRARQGTPGTPETTHVEYRWDVYAFHFEYRWSIYERTITSRALDRPWRPTDGAADEPTTSRPTSRPEPAVIGRAGGRRPAVSRGRAAGRRRQPTRSSPAATCGTRHAERARAPPRCPPRSTRGSEMKRLLLCLTALVALTGCGVREGAAGAACVRACVRRPRPPPTLGR